MSYKHFYLIKIKDKIKELVTGELNGKSILFAFDGWKNTVTKDKHVCIFAFELRPIFIKSSVVPDQNSGTLFNLLLQALDEVDKCNGYVLDIIADNAPTCHAKIDTVMETKQGVCACLLYTSPSPRD